MLYDTRAQVELHFTSIDRARSAHDLLLACPAASATTTITNYHMIPNFVVAPVPIVEEDDCKESEIVQDSIIAVYDPEDEWHAKLVPSEPLNRSSSAPKHQHEEKTPKNRQIRASPTDMHATHGAPAWIPGNEPQRRAHSVENNAFLALADDSGSDDDETKAALAGTGSSGQSSTSDFWSCPHCTFHNTNLFAEFCCVCEQSRFL